MGWDISYHPFAPEEVTSVYFAGVENPLLAAELAQKYAVHEFHHENLADFLAGCAEEENTDFAKGHGYRLAIVAGFLRKFWYVRGGALSFLADDPDFTPYFTDWKTLVPEKYHHLTFPNALPENYSCGVFLSAQSLAALRADYDTRPEIKEKVDELFSHGRLNVFWNAVAYAVENSLGLVEAAEVIEPNPLDLNNSKCYSNLHNCDPEGAILYHQAALEQIAQLNLEQQKTTEQEPAAMQDDASDECPELPPYKDGVAGDDKCGQLKKGFFARLFGR